MMNLLGKDLDLLENEFNEHPEWHLQSLVSLGVKIAEKWGI